MNECFFIGEIISDLDFEFLINSKNISIIKFKIKLEDENTIIVKGYNNIADFCYKNLKCKDKVFICGKIDSRMEIIINEISK